MRFRVPFIKPEFPSIQLLSEDHKAIIINNWYTNFGPYEKRFSAALAKYIGQGVQTTTTANATLALMLSLRALLKPSTIKRKVLIPSFTFVAGVEAIVWCALEPVFIDIDAETWQPALSEAESYLAEHADEVAGILFCNNFGVGTPNIEKWEALAKAYGLPLIIDSAAGFGSAYPDGSMLGGRGDCEVFSFHATKPFSIGEGGGVSSRSSELIATLKKLQNFGFNQQREVDQLGLNAKLSELSCAIGLRQFENISEKLENRRSILQIYKDRLQPLGYAFQVNDERSTIAFASVVAKTPEQARRLYDQLLDRDIEVKRYYNPALHVQPAFRDYAHQPLPITEDICSRIVSLPVHSGVSESVFEEIVACAR